LFNHLTNNRLSNSQYVLATHQGRRQNVECRTIFNLVLLTGSVCFAILEFLTGPVSKNFTKTTDKNLLVPENFVLI
ncbi:MAG: hypothetical protein ACE5NM_08355, partial [Sedimentisphaerales bacterium]